jgi:hypothetical protein
VATRATIITITNQAGIIASNASMLIYPYANTII